MLKALELGKQARFNHSDVGLIDVVIQSKSPVGDFYSCSVTHIHMQDVNLNDYALTMQKMFQIGLDVNVFLRPQELVEYL